MCRMTKHIGPGTSRMFQPSSYGFLHRTTGTQHRSRDMVTDRMHPHTIWCITHREPHSPRKCMGVVPFSILMAHTPIGIRGVAQRHNQQKTIYVLRSQSELQVTGSTGSISAWQPYLRDAWLTEPAYTSQHMACLQRSTCISHYVGCSSPATCDQV